tara:strand:- start:2897 stop:3097 length:201 start_codon:yes stop_codon:yes gene_type:complete
MANMSYCRFENTSKDLEDCIEALHNYEDKCNSLSSYEVEALQDLVEQAKEIIDLTYTIDKVIQMNK